MRKDQSATVSLKCEEQNVRHSYDLASYSLQRRTGRALARLSTN